MAALRWGICATGNISFDFTSALCMRDAAKHKIVAVAARDHQKATEFAAKFGIPKAYSDYSALASDSEIDVVYVGTRNNTHYELSKQFLNAGKHVVCETSLTCAAWQARELAALAKEKGLLFMESIWSRCFPLYKTIRELIDSNELGTVRSVEVHFTFDARRLDAACENRLLNTEFYGGALRDVGMYALQFAEWVFREKPTRVHAVGRLLPNGVDASVCMALQYAAGRFANLTVSISSSADQTATVFGDKADLHVCSPCHAPLALLLTGRNGESRKIESEPLPKARYETNYENSAGFAYEADHVYDCIKQGLLESALIPHELSIWIQETIDDCLKQLSA